MNERKRYSDDEIVKRVKDSAKAYSDFCGKDMIYVSINQNKNNLYMFEAKYQARHFQHLCGIQSKTMPATAFYYECLKNDSKITIADCTPSYEHSKLDICDKITSLPRLLDKTNFRSFRSGKRIPGVGNVDFDFAVGDNCFLGYQYNSKEKKYIPLTNMIAPIASYCTSPERISLIMSKDYNKKKYDTIEYEITKNLLLKLDDDIKKALSSFIDDELLQQELNNQKDSKSIEQE